MRLLSASSAWRYEICAGSAALPRVEWTSAAGERGREVHAKREAKPPEGGIPEVAFAYDVMTGKARELGRSLGRNYPSTAHSEIVGTLDLLFLHEKDVEVVDYKTGAGFMVPPAAKSLQLATYALMAARAHGKDSALVGHVFTDQDDRAEVASLDPFDLAEIAVRLKAMWLAAREAHVAVKSGTDPRVVTGKHCDGCPAIQSCPAHLNMAMAISAGVLPKLLPDQTLTPSVVADGWRNVALAERVIKAFKSTVYAYAAQSPIPLGEGRFLGQVSEEREQLDARVVRQVLRDLHGEAVADAAVQMETSKAALERALAPIAPPRGKAALVRSALEAVQQANGIHRKQITSIKEFTP